MEAVTVMAWVLISTARVHGGSGAVAYSPPLPTQVECETLKSSVMLRHQEARSETGMRHVCQQLPIVVGATPKKDPKK